MLVEATLVHLADLNRGKLCPPAPGPLLRRDRLLSRLAALSHCKAALICAEAGYGKTTLVLDFLANGWPHPVVWYRLGKSDRDVTQFAAYLTVGIAEQLPSFGAEIRRRRSESGGGPMAFELSNVLLQEMRKATPQPLLIVLDNFEVVATSQEVCTLVAGLLEYSGPNVHLAIASRIAPPLPVARLEASRQAIVLRPEDLALTAEESRELLNGLHGASLTGPQLEVLWRRTEGWVAGLMMVLGALRGRAPDEVLTNLEGVQGSHDLVYRYFAEEVFQQQDAELQQFLVKTSVLTKLTHDVVNELLEIDNGGELLDVLRASGIFAHSIEGSSSDLRYHGLFRGFLLDRLHAHHGDEYIHQLYRQAARAALRYRRWSEAIDCYAMAEDWGDVVAVVEQVGGDFVARGFLETVRHWLSTVPEEEVLRRPVLLFIRGQLLRRAGRLHEALWDLDRAVEGFREQDAREAEVLARLQKGISHNLLGQFRVAEIVLGEALSRAGDDPELRSLALADLSFSAVRSDELEKAVRWGEMAAAESASCRRGPKGRLSLVRALRFRSQALLLQGELRQGIQDVSNALNLGRQEGIGDIEATSSLLVLGQGLVLQGDLDRARSVLDEAEALAHGTERLLDRIWTWRGTANRDLGAFDLAEQDYCDADVWAQGELAIMRLRQGRISEGLRLAEVASEASTTREGLGDGAACQAIHGIALLAAGEHRRALQQMQGAAETFRQRGRLHQLASVRWPLARTLLDEGRPEQATEQLRAAISWMGPRGIYQLWWWNPETVALLWPLAFKLGLDPAYLLKLAELRLGQGEVRFLYGALDAPDPAWRARLMKTLNLVSQGSGVAEQAMGDLLGSCQDPFARRCISDAVAAGLLGPRDVAFLRGDARLTWKELEVLILYYLHRNEQGGGLFRQRLAETLVLSEHTLKTHIRSIRQKLDLPSRSRGTTLSLGLMQRLRQKL